jgi:hypothetical protein
VVLVSRIWKLQRTMMNGVVLMIRYVSWFTI